MALAFSKISFRVRLTAESWRPTAKAQPALVVASASKPKAVRILAVPAFHGFGITNAPSRSWSARNTLYFWSRVTVAMLRIESQIVSWVHTPVVLFRVQPVAPGRLTSERKKCAQQLIAQENLPHTSSSKMTEKDRSEQRPAPICCYCLLVLVSAVRARCLPSP
jgi:hypothetical protein